MPGLQDRNQVRSEEYQEFPITGPFGGIQSELPLDQIELIGFADITNMMLRKGVCRLRPGFTPLTPFPIPVNEPVLGIADFFTRFGDRIQTVLTQTRLLRWNPVSADWTEITGPGFTGAPAQTFAWDVLANKLCFSQGADKIFYWDGVTVNYAQTSVNAPKALFLAEIGLHLMALNVDVGGGPLTQTYMWSGVGDPTDWVSFNSGRNDNLNNLGPGRGLLKLGQYGYGWHNWGIVQIQPTGIGVAPFYFTPIANSNVGNICNRSLTRFNREGVECAAYMGKDNVYIFNQSSVIPIGDAPIDGRRRIGARSRILADLVTSNSLTAFGFVTQNIVGEVFNAYWLIIPNVAIWVYNFDESNWTRFQYNGTQTVAGLFFWQRGIRIMDLIGTIAQQNWTPATINPNLLFDGFGIGYTNGQVAYIDFTNYSELPGQVVSGKHIFQDRRHSKSVKKFRLTVQDNGAATYVITVSNNKGYQETQTVVIGNGSGDSISTVIPFNVSGLRITWSCSVLANTPASIIEFCPMFDVSGEQRGGTVD
jgi:hypothetical protein